MIAAERYLADTLASRSGSRAMLAWLDSAVFHYFSSWQFATPEARLQTLADLAPRHREGDHESLVMCDPPDPASAMVLAEGLALLSFQPGGVQYAGLHWDAPTLRARWQDRVEHDWGPADTGFDSWCEFMADSNAALAEDAPCEHCGTSIWNHKPGSCASDTSTYTETGRAA
jgi:hypothetical protein